MLCFKGHCLVCGKKPQKIGIEQKEDRMNTIQKKQSIYQIAEYKKIQGC